MVPMFYLQEHLPSLRVSKLNSATRNRLFNLIFYYNLKLAWSLNYIYCKSLIIA